MKKYNYKRYCKTILGLKKTSCTISAKSELGRFPITSFIKTQVLMYFVRINSNNINPLIKESLNVNKKKCMMKANTHGILV